MARIAGVDLPRDKRVEYALPDIFGIGLANGRIILGQAEIDLRTRVSELTEAQVARLRCLLYTSPSPRDQRGSRMPSSA